MGMIEMQIAFKDLRRRNIVQFDGNDVWRPYLILNTDRAYFYLNGQKIFVVSRDFRMCRNMAQINRERNCWNREHRKKNTPINENSIGSFPRSSVKSTAISKGTQPRLPSRNSSRNTKDEIGVET